MWPASSWGATRKLVAESEWSQLSALLGLLLEVEVEFAVGSLQLVVCSWSLRLGQQAESGRVLPQKFGCEVWLQKFACKSAVRPADCLRPRLRMGDLCAIRSQCILSLRAAVRLAWLAATHSPSETVHRIPANAYLKH